MQGETDLKTILKELAPTRNKGEYIFCTVFREQEINSDDIIGSFREAEGLTVILERSVADSHGLPFNGVFSWITLNVHSSLEAVGLTAAVSKALAEEGISCNIVAANCHDHIFVPLNDAERAMKVLRQLLE